MTNPMTTDVAVCVSGQNRRRVTFNPNIDWKKEDEKSLRGQQKRSEKKKRKRRRKEQKRKQERKRRRVKMDNFTEEKIELARFTITGYLAYERYQDLILDWCENDERCKKLVISCCKLIGYEHSRETLRNNIDESSNAEEEDIQFIRQSLKEMAESQKKGSVPFNVVCVSKLLRLQKLFLKIQLEELNGIDWLNEESESDSDSENNGIQPTMNTKVRSPLKPTNLINVIKKNSDHSSHSALSCDSGHSNDSSSSPSSSESEGSSDVENSEEESTSSGSDGSSSYLS